MALRRGKGDKKGYTQNNMTRAATGVPLVGDTHNHMTNARAGTSLVF